MMLASHYRVPSKHAMCLGYVQYVRFGDKVTESHYAVCPDGTVLVSTRNPLHGQDFGCPGSWRTACAFPEYVQQSFEFIGNYPIPEVY
jgi:hypothetical protein